MDIVRALDLRLRSQSLEQVRAIDLCADVDISRTAFYRHFASVYDVPCWLWNRIIADTLGRIGPEVSFYEAHLACFTAALEWRDFFQNCFKVSGIDGPFHRSERLVLDLYRDAAMRLRGAGLSADEELLVRFYNAGAAAMTREWACGGMEQTPQQMATCFSASAPECLKRILEAGSPS